MTRDALLLLRRIGAGERVIKTALAAALAWKLGSLVPGVSDPYLAPVVAILATQSTVADSVTLAAQRTLGMIAGVIVALVIGSVLGINTLSIGLLVLFSLMLGVALKLTPQGTQQIAVSAVLVATVGGHTGSVPYAIARIAEGTIGALVGVGLNALLAPPSHLDAARSKATLYTNALANVLERLAAAVDAGITPDAAAAVLDEARAAVKPEAAARAAAMVSRTALQYNMWRRADRPAATRLLELSDVLERVSIQARGVVRTVNEAAAGQPPPFWLDRDGSANVFASMPRDVALLIRSFAKTAIDGEPAPEAETRRILDRLARADDALEAGGVRRFATGDTAGWIELGSVTVDLYRMQRELYPDLIESRDKPVPATAPRNLPGSHR